MTSVYINNPIYILYIVPVNGQRIVKNRVPEKILTLILTNLNVLKILHNAYTTFRMDAYL